MDHTASPQPWRRDTTGPCIALGAAGNFDDTHLFAPCVAREHGQYRMWYCGARGTVADRVYGLGLAHSDDGVHFARHSESPILRLKEPDDSIVTPTLLREASGELRRERGLLRMWFVRVNFKNRPLYHTLHEMTSEDGIHWNEPTPVQAEHVYAPTVVHDQGVYHLWATGVATEPWCVLHARSRDGVRWTFDDRPAVVLDQAWEHGNLFYPFVLRDHGKWMMWYGAYWAQDQKKTALGFAVSDDGIHWTKHSGNPVLRPDPTREWESHFNTSQTVLKLDDGSWRIWYAGRKQPPHVNKYFSIGTAHTATLGA